MDMAGIVRITSILLVLNLILGTSSQGQNEDCRIDLMFLWDRSGSICDKNPTFDPVRKTCDNWETMRDFILKYVGEKEIGPSGTQVGMITFDTEARIEWGLNAFSNSGQIESAIRGIEYLPFQHTHTADALEKLIEAFKVGNRPDADDVAIIITDGNPYDENQFLMTPMRALEVQAAGIFVYSIGIGSEINEDLLKTMSSAPQKIDETYFMSPNFIDIKDLQGPISAGSCRSKPPEEKGSDCLLDIVLLLDRSGSICADKDVPTCDNWKTVINFLAELFKGMQIGDDGARVALIIFDSSAMVVWNLDKYTDGGSLRRAIMELKYVPMQTTHTALALQLAMSEVLTGRGADRPEAQNIILILTDGKPVPDEQYIQTIPAAEQAKGKGAKIISIAIGVTNDIDKDLLERVASKPEGNDVNFFKSPSFEEINLLVQQIQDETCQKPAIDCMLDIALLVDSSGSICNNSRVETCDNWKTMTKFLGDVFGDLTIGDMGARVALIVFGSSAEVVWNLDKFSDAKSLSQALRQLKYVAEQTTHTALALDLALKEVLTGSSPDRSEAPNLIFVVTDGKPFPEEQQRATPGAAQRAKDAGARIFAIGVTDKIDGKHLQEMSSPPHELNKNYFTSPSFEEVTHMVEDVQKEACLQPSKKKSECKLDIALLLDRSGSICDDKPVDTCQNWQTMTKFVADVFGGLAIGGDGARVALITFDSDAKVVWNLDKYSDASRLNKAILALEYKAQQTTHTAKALEIVLKEVFTGSEPDRKDASNVIIVVTDGKPFPESQFQAAPGAAEAAKRAGSKIFAIGVTEEIDEKLLKSMSSGNRVKGRDYFTSPSFDKVNDLVIGIQEGTCEGPALPGCLLDIVVLLDRSGSICQEKSVTTCDNWETMKKFLAELFQGMKIGKDGAQVALITFDSVATVVWDLDKYTDVTSLGDALLNLKYEPQQTTHTAKAIELAMLSILTGSGADRSDAQNYILLVTDGKPYPKEQYDRTLPAATEAKGKGAKIVAIGVTEKIDGDLLKNISSEPQEVGVSYFTSPSFEEINTLVAEIQGETCSGGMTPPPKLTLKKCQMDLVLILDRSGSICDDKYVFDCKSWQDALNFLISLVKDIDVSPDGARVALITFNTRVKLEFGLLSYPDLDGLVDAISNIKYEPFRRTYTADALRMVDKVFGSEDLGDREGVPNVLVIVTDGQPTNGSQRAQTLPLALAAQQRGILMFSVGVTADIEEETLKGLSSEPKQLGVSYFRSPDFSSIGAISSQVQAAACDGATNGKAENRPSVPGVGDPKSPYPPAPAPPAAYPPAPAPVSPPPDPESPYPPTQGAVCVMDVVFALDVSGLLCDNKNVGTCPNFELMKEFVGDVVTRLDIGTDKTRVAVVVFGNSVTVQFGLDKYPSSQAVANAITAIQYTPYQSTHTANAIRKISSDVLSAANQRPMNTKKVAIIITHKTPTSIVQRNMTVYEAVNLKSMGVTIVPVGILLDLDEYMVEMMASGRQTRGADYFLLDSYSSLPSYVNPVSNFLGLPSTCKEKL